MSDVQFDEGQDGSRYAFQSRKILGEPTTPGAVRFMMKLSFFKNESVAGWALVAASILLFIAAGAVTAYFVFGVGRSNEVKYVYPEEFLRQIRQSQ